MDNIYYKCILRKKIKVDPKYLNENLDEFLINYLKNKIEGRCMDEGYIRPESIRLLKRSAGLLLGSRFTGDITYEVAYSAEVCNPSQGTIIDAKVLHVTKVGLMCLNGPLSLFVPKKNHENNLDNFLKIKIGDMVRIEVESKKFSLNDTQIQISGKIHGMKNKKNKVIENVKKVTQEIKKDTGDNDSEKEFDLNDDENDIDDIEIEDSEEEDEDSDEEDESSDDELEQAEENVDEFITEADKIGGMDTKEFGDDFEELDDDMDDVDDDIDDDDGYATE